MPFRNKFSDTKPEPEPQKPRSKDKHLRGRERITQAKALVEARKHIPKGDKGIKWGGIILPTEAATQNFLFVGQIKSGKTVSMKYLMAQVLPFLGTGNSDLRALVYDAKGDMVSFLYALLENRSHSSPKNIIKILNPFDERCVAWNIAADVTEPAHVQTVATIIVPEDKGQNRFFTDAARQLLEGVMMAFILISRRERREQLHWTLRDVCLALREESSLKELIGKHDETKHLTAYLDRANNEVLATVKSYIAPFEIVAAAWHTAEMEGLKEQQERNLERNPRLLSLREWRDDPQGKILVLGRDPEARASIEGINRVMIERLSQVILKGDETPQPRTWFFLDEFSKMGVLTGFDDLITNGRSKGACIALAFQNIQGIKAVYGEELADEIISECGSKAILKCDGAVSRWASEEVGMRQIERTERSSTRVGEYQISESTVRGEEYVLFPSDFSGLPIAGKDNGVHGYYFTSWLDGVWDYAQQWGEDEFGEIAGLESTEPNFIDRAGSDADYQLLKTWRPKERGNFGLFVELPPPSEEYLNS